MSSTGSGRRQPRTRPFANEVVFKFRQRRKEVKYQFAHARGRIDLFLKTPEMHALAMEGVDHGDEMGQRPAEAI